MVEAGLDAVIYPTTALPAFPHGKSRMLTPTLTYTFLANLLHWPAGVVPVTRVLEHEEVRGGGMRQAESVSGGSWKPEPRAAGGGRGMNPMCSDRRMNKTRDAWGNIRRYAFFESLRYYRALSCE